MKDHWTIKVDGKVIADGFSSIYPALAYIEKAVDEGIITYSEKADCSGYTLDANSIDFTKQAK